ncbi:Uncharacterized membrane protein YhaH, DUF805 family [Sphingomonas sp. YR710]|uniref:DUF805 domain-containing protein n=1 Tax=Sphingomonas sp. YR710 TaxID=1882773 RepID=UPI0008806C5E|nr:DUF805 domain-containing protein [Sphingomonas sp. YR710]SDD84719.1 Uncharacterized membrane protein YhaH, DUF805 family [Sphingomonas sp. YR710]
MIDDEALKSIERLHRLKSDGVITEEDFEKSKEKLLFGSGRKVRVQTTNSEATLPADGDHIGWMVLALKRYADFNGRSGRKEYWMFELLTVAWTLACFVMAIVLAGAAAGLWLIGLLGLVVPRVAAQARRFHDQDRSGWMALINLVPFVGPFLVLGLMLIDGTPGGNRFGPSPKLG